MCAKCLTRNAHFFKQIDIWNKSSSIKSFLPAFVSKNFYHASQTSPNIDKKEIIGNEKERNMSKAMRAYLKRSSEYDKFITEKVVEYEIGKRHLANMMGENPETFTQDDIDNAIAYLFPSGLFEPKARPAMKHPSELFAQQKAAEFDNAGRPFHSLFYTGRPAFYTIMQEIAIKAIRLNVLASNVKADEYESDKFYESSRWIKKHKLEEILLERISDLLFDQFIKSMERLKDHRMSIHEKDFIMKFREGISNKVTFDDVPPLMYTEDGTPYMKGIGRRKCATAEVTVYGHGTGKFRVNGNDILYFEFPQDREQVMFPLQFTDNLRSVDVEAFVNGSGKSGQAGAIRYALAMALRSFVPSEMVEKMRIAGLLTEDLRRRERKKPGQRRARAKFTWKKR